MRILIDCSQTPQKKGGVGNYAVNLVREIARQDKCNTYFVLIQSDENASDDIKNEKLHRIYVKSRVFRRLFFRFLLEQFYIPYFMISHRIQLIHSLHYSFPLITFGKKKTVTLADMTFFLMPTNHTFIKRHYFRLFIMLAAILADRIIAISKSTRQDFHNRIHAAPEVTGDAAWLVDPLSVGELSDALRELLENPALRQEMSFRGIEQAKKFSWKKTAMKTIVVYGDALRSAQ